MLGSASLADAQHWLQPTWENAHFSPAKTVTFEARELFAHLKTDFTKEPTASAGGGAGGGQRDSQRPKKEEGLRVGEERRLGGRGAGTGQGALGLLSERAQPRGALRQRDS